MGLVKIANKRQRMNRANNYNRIVEKLSEPAQSEVAPVAAKIEQKVAPVAEKIEKKVLSKIPKKYLIGAGSIAALAGAGYGIKKHYNK